MNTMSYIAYHKQFAEDIRSQAAKSRPGNVIITSYEEAFDFIRKARCNYNYALLSFIDESIVDYQLSKMACLVDSRSLLFVKAEFLNQRFFSDVFTPFHLQFMPFWAKEMWMCTWACEEWAGWLSKVPYAMRTLELCQMAYTQNDYVIKSVPAGMRELLVKA
jgi:hypothetical protein